MARRGLIAALALLAAAWLHGGPARAEEATSDRVELDSARSHATFGIKVMWLVTVHGAGHFPLKVQLAPCRERLWAAIAGDRAGIAAALACCPAAVTP